MLKGETVRSRIGVFPLNSEQLLTNSLNKGQALDWINVAEDRDRGGLLRT